MSSSQESKYLDGDEYHQFNTFKHAISASTPEEFLRLIFPIEWYPIRARIVETGVEFYKNLGNWAPRWSRVPRTTRGNPKHDIDYYIRSCIFRAHDFIHQLWGLPIPIDFSEKEKRFYKKAQMAGEVAVLTLTEFVLCKHIYDRYTIARPTIENRFAMSMLRGPLNGKTAIQIAIRLDELLHKKYIEQDWVQESECSKQFADYYIPMLQGDREDIDHNWNIMKTKGKPLNAINYSYNRNLTGLELTIWMIENFFNLMGTSADIDWELTFFNRERRRKIIIPEGWHIHNQGETP